MDDVFTVRVGAAGVSVYRADVRAEDAARAASHAAELARDAAADVGVAPPTIVEVTATADTHALPEGFRSVLELRESKFARAYRLGLQ